MAINYLSLRVNDNEIIIINNYCPTYLWISYGPPEAHTGSYHPLLWLELVEQKFWGYKETAVHLLTKILLGLLQDQILNR